MITKNEYREFLIKYGEIGIKGRNRYIFENALMEQIRFSLAPLDGEYEVTKEQGRIYVEVISEDYEYEETLEALQRVFGIVHICPVMVVESTVWADLEEAVGRHVACQYPEDTFTFKMEAKRGNKQYPLTSPEICAKMGEYLLNRFSEKLKVDVHHPQKRITLEVRNKGYIYSEEIPGPGGMPIGTAGKAMLLLSGGIDSPVAGYMIAKRGVRLEATYFHAPPYTSDRAKKKVVDLAKQVARYAGPIRLHVINFTEIQLFIYDQCPHEELTIIMRRYMMKIAEDLAKKGGCLGLVTGESIGQVASQTMQSLAATNAVCSLPVYRPLIAFDKQDIVAISERIGTYETSIQPFEDCCTIFVAKHPVTKPEISVIERSEEKLAEKIEEMVRTALETEEVIEVTGE
ncbi:MAG: tRNA 4-thiouridine(8) synthase ThiI [Lachnospiraceae bacterium]|jgi:thiamine biosynthesis protein ThiI|nr:tRNA 4-thiouridine(8) synthase ThiI [Lachnospiraceae bacterium]